MDLINLHLCSSLSLESLSPWPTWSSRMQSSGAFLRPLQHNTFYLTFNRRPCPALSLTIHHHIQSQCLPPSRRKQEPNITVIIKTIG